MKNTQSTISKVTVLQTQNANGVSGIIKNLIETATKLIAKTALTLMSFTLLTVGVFLISMALSFLVAELTGYWFLGILTMGLLCITFFFVISAFSSKILHFISRYFVRKVLKD